MTDVSANCKNELLLRNLYGFRTFTGRICYYVKVSFPAVKPMDGGSIVFESTRVIFRKAIRNENGSNAPVKSSN